MFVLDPGILITEGVNLLLGAMVVHPSYHNHSASLLVVADTPACITDIAAYCVGEIRYNVHVRMCISGL